MASPEKGAPMPYQGGSGGEGDRELLRRLAGRSLPLHLGVSILWWMLTKLGVSFE